MGVQRELQKVKKKSYRDDDMKDDALRNDDEADGGTEYMLFLWYREFQNFISYLLLLNYQKNNCLAVKKHF